MAHVLFIHGLDNKPEAGYLYALWKRKLAHDDGPSLDDAGVESCMAYWADVLYGAPDTNLAAYESRAGDIEGLAGTNAPALDPDALAPEDAQHLRALAARLGVDASAVTDDVPPPDEIAGVQQERIPVPEWLRKRIMAKLMRDAHHYFFNVEFAPRPGAGYRVRDELRKRFIDGLKAGAGKGPQVVVSHSMGTIIAYDCLMNVPECPAVDGLITIGSPLGLDEVQDFFPGRQRDNSFPGAKLRGKWINVYDPLDVVAMLDPRLANDYRNGGERVVEDLAVENTGYWRHSISKYLQQTEVRRRLAAMLGITWP